MFARSPTDTLPGEIMSSPVMCVHPDPTSDECMALMTENRLRHLPVMDGGRLVGLVSIGDLVKATISEQQFIIEQLEHHTSGQSGRHLPTGYGAALTVRSPLKLATWNVNSLAVRLPQLLAWLAAHPVDAIVLQETKLTDDKFPHAEIAAAGYQAQWFGQRTYNGVAILARGEISEVVRNVPGFDDEQARVIAATVEGVRIVGAYFPNGQAPGSEKFAYKMRWIDALREWLRSELAAHPRLALLGDYNIAPEDRDVHDPAAWLGQIHCTPEEREHFRRLLGLGLHDAFRLFEQPPRSWSWWDYRNLAFRRNQGLRIDHVLVSEALKARVSACSIDKEPRKAERPSDHAPVIVELAA